MSLLNEKTKKNLCFYRHSIKIVYISSWVNCFAHPIEIVHESAISFSIFLSVIPISVKEVGSPISCMNSAKALKTIKVLSLKYPIIFSFVSFSTSQYF